MNFPSKTQIRNYRSGEVYILQPAIDVHVTEKLKQQIVSRCNEPAIYEFLFRSKLAGKPYEIKMASEFIDWSRCGWETHEYFVFFISNYHGELVACIDIKSANLASAEIGYWASTKFPGIMTNAVIQLSQLAKQTGFLRFFANVRKDNLKSANVLTRAGFEFDDVSAEGQDRYYQSLA